MEFTTTSKGRPRMTYEGYQYNIRPAKTTANQLVWRCAKDKNCNGMLFVNGTTVVRSWAHKPVCKPDVEGASLMVITRTAKALAKKRVREELDTPIAEIVREVYRPLVESGKLKNFNKDSMMRQLHKDRSLAKEAEKRRQEQPPLPEVVHVQPITIPKTPEEMEQDNLRKLTNWFAKSTKKLSAPRPKPSTLPVTQPHAPAPLHYASLGLASQSHSSTLAQPHAQVPLPYPSLGLVPQLHSPTHTHPRSQAPPPYPSIGLVSQIDPPTLTQPRDPIAPDSQTENSFTFRQEMTFVDVASPKSETLELNGIKQEVQSHYEEVLETVPDSFLPEDSGSRPESQDFSECSFSRMEVTEEEFCNGIGDSDSKSSGAGMESPRPSVEDPPVKSEKAESRHVMFLKSIAPSLDDMNDAETLQFQAAVITTIMDIKKARNTQN